jgi:hypothetical protein
MKARRQAAPGDLRPQCGQRGSLALISSRQLGQMMELLCTGIQCFGREA